MANPGPRSYVEAPPAAGPRFGLRASIPVTTDVGRWETGIQYVPEGCSEGERFGDLCTVPMDVADTSMPDAVQWDPYVLSVSETCSTFSMRPEEMAGRAERLLNMDTERQLGQELWDGTLAQATAGSVNTWLADDSQPNFEVLGTGGAEYSHALACLEQYLADNNGGQQGVIHATVQTVAHWESFRLLRREGNMILTFKDTVVIPSPGYSGNSPDGITAVGDVWAYATDMPRIFLGDIQIFTSELQSVDRTVNTVQVVAQRFALVEWQRCRHAGISIDITPCGAY